MIAGSTLLTDSVPADQHPNVQGTTDVLMGFGGATAGLLSGVVVGFGSYALLTIATTCLIVPLLIGLIAVRYFMLSGAVATVGTIVFASAVLALETYGVLGYLAAVLRKAEPASV